MPVDSVESNRWAIVALYSARYWIRSPYQNLLRCTLTNPFWLLDCTLSHLRDPSHLASGDRIPSSTGPSGLHERKTAQGIRYDVHTWLKRPWTWVVFISNIIGTFIFGPNPPLHYVVCFSIGKWYPSYTWIPWSKWSKIHGFWKLHKQETIHCLSNC